MSGTDNIRETLNEMMGAEDVRLLASQVPTQELLALITDEEERVARHAAWVLTHKPINEIRKLPQERLIGIALDTTSSSQRRLMLNLIEQQKIKKEDIRTDFLDFCLKHMMMMEEPAGVQALCLKLAYQMCHYYPELEREFEESLKLMPAEQYKAGVRHLIKKLKAGNASTNNNDNNHI